ncbi:hypothetical protein ACQPWR_05540 [Micromonospora vinacea]|uniref:hypothetical protein n=1 Tax=Micromonospora vinacea TaxID=709878 RepID=UPI003D901159
MTSEEIFGPDFIVRRRQSSANLPADHHRLTFDIAVEPQYQHWWDWYDEQLALLPSFEGEQLAELWKDQFS